MKRLAALLFLISSTLMFAQTQIDPTYQVAWNLLTGSGAPTITCTQNGNYTVYPYGAEWGQSYQDTTNNVEYKCTNSGWVKNLPTTGGTLTGALNGTSASFSGAVAAGTATPTTIGSNGVLLNGVPALQSQTSLNNYYSGGAGNLTGTGSQNTANGFQALYSNTTGSKNTANGSYALYSNTTGSYNSAQGYNALYYNTTGSYNVANGYNALSFNTTGTYNAANGQGALDSNTTGSNNTANGFTAGRYITGGAVGLTNPTTSIFIGTATQAKADNGTNEIVIGAGVTGNGSNTATLGTGLTDTYLAGTQHITATIPTASAGTPATYSTNAGGAITGLSAAVATTITFANSGWANTAFCVANASVSLATNIYVSAISKTSVTFTFPALTGTLYYHCDGN